MMNENPHISRNLQALLAVILVGILMGFSTNSSAQKAISSIGIQATGAGGSADITVGPISYTNHVGSNGSVSLGVQQAYIPEIVGDNDIGMSKLIKVYPNPTVDVINISTGSSDPALYSYILYDLSGAVILSESIGLTNHSIPVKNLPTASYILTIQSHAGVLSTYKIQKI